MSKSKPDKIKFLIHAAIWSLLIMAIMQAYAPYVVPPTVNEKAAASAAAGAVLVDAAAVPKLLRHADGKPTLLVIHASWCGYCRQMMPRLAELIREKKLDGVHVVVLSLDTKLQELGRYLVHNDYTGLWTPYVLRSDPSGVLLEVLARAGSSYDGPIPYTALFDGKGQVVDQEGGVVGKLRLLEMVGKGVTGY